MVIIGILASIAIPKFGSTKERAYLAKMKSDLRNLATAQESYLGDNQVYYGGAVPNAPFPYNPSSGTTVTIAEATTGGWSATTAYTGTHQDLRVLLRIRRAARAGNGRGAHRLRPVMRCRGVTHGSGPPHDGPPGGLPGGPLRSLRTELLFNLAFLTSAAVILASLTTLLVATLDPDAAVWALGILWAASTAALRALRAPPGPSAGARPARASSRARPTGWPTAS